LLVRRLFAPPGNQRIPENGAARQFEEQVLDLARDASLEMPLS
jgi:hypothetical protein